MLFCYSRQQSSSIYDQLCFGIRFLDFRLHVDELDSAVHLSHSFDTRYTLRDALGEIRLFLEENPTEFIIIYLRIDHWWREDKSKGRRTQAILEILKSSRLKFADVVGESIHQICVSDVAGQVIIMLPDNSTVVPSSCGQSFVDSRRFYKVFDVWRCQSVSEATTCLDKHMVSRVEWTGHFGISGIALDLSVTGLPPSWTSHKLNDWFLSKLENDPDWSSCEAPIGVLMVDFADERLVRRLLSVVGLVTNSD